MGGLPNVLIPIPTHPIQRGRKSETTEMHIDRVTATAVPTGVGLLVSIFKRNAKATPTNYIGSLHPVTVRADHDFI